MERGVANRADSTRSNQIYQSSQSSSRGHVALMLRLLVSASLLVGILSDGKASTRPALITIVGRSYVMSPLKMIVGDAPTELYYDRGDVYYNWNNITFVLRSGAEAEKPLKTPMQFQSRKRYVDDFGNRMIHEDFTTQLITANPFRKLTVFTSYGKNTSHTAVDADKNRIYLLGYDSSSSSDRARLFCFDTTDPDIVGGRVEAEQITQAGDKLTAIALDKTTGSLVLASQATAIAWSLTSLKPVSEEACKIPPEEGIHKSSLIAAVRLAGDELIRLYEDAILGRESSEILNAGKATAYPSGGPIKPSAHSAKPTTTTPSYDGIRAKDHNFCGGMYESIDKAKKSAENSLSRIKIKYNTLYEKAFNSEITKTFQKTAADFKDAIVFPKTVAECGGNSSKSVVCYEGAAIEATLARLKRTEAVVKKMASWITFLVETTDEVADSDEFVENEVLKFDSRSAMP